MTNNKGSQSLAPLPEGQIRSELFVNKTSEIKKASCVCTECQSLEDEGKSSVPLSRYHAAY
jgi:hypothetical protein